MTGFRKETMVGFELLAFMPLLAGFALPLLFSLFSQFPKSRSCQTVTEMKPQACPILGRRAVGSVVSYPLSLCFPQKAILMSGPIPAPESQGATNTLVVCVSREVGLETPYNPTSFQVKKDTKLVLSTDKFVLVLG